MPSSRDRHSNVTVFLRDRRVLVTVACHDDQTAVKIRGVNFKPIIQSTTIQTLTMKTRYLLVDLIRRTSGALAAAALVFSQPAALFADGSNDRKQSEAAVKALNHIIIIYQENWSFDALYGQFPGASGYALSFDTLPQYDVTASPPYSQLIYKTPRPLNGGPDPNFPASPDGNLALSSNHNVALPLIPYDFTQYIAADAKTGDIVHRFYHEQLQIDNGVLEKKIGDLGKFVTWSDNPGLVLSYIDATSLPEGLLAEQYTLCDNFFHSAYGGSFLNHQWLIAAATPPWTTPIPAGFQSSWNPGTLSLTDANLTIDGKFAVNTTQPLLAPFSPNNPTAKRLLINNTDKSQPGYTPNIGNRLDDAGINWRWYSGGWNEALADNNAANNELFQFHHQPFAYFTKYAPFLTAPTTDYSSSNP